MRVQFNNRSRSVLLIAIAWIWLIGTTSAQTVSPLVSELGNPAKGWVEYYNGELTPLNVVLEAKSFTVSETGEISYRPLDPAIQLKLSVTSFRIEPKQTYYVSYEARAEQGPAWFVLYAAFSGFRMRLRHGVNTRLLLPHTVYLLPKRSLEKSQVEVARAEFSPAEGKVVIDVANTSDYFGRVTETQVIFAKQKQEAPGFALFPHSHRILEVPLQQEAERDSVPIAVLLRFQNFNIEQKLQRRSLTASAHDP